MGRLAPAVTRAADIPELFLLGGDGALSAPESARKPELPRTTVHEPVTTPAACSCPAPAPVPGQPGRHRPGVWTHRLGNRCAEQFDLAAEGRQVAGGAAELPARPGHRGAM